MPRVRNSLRTHVGDLDVGAVACGLGRAIGNSFLTVSFVVIHGKLISGSFVAEENERAWIGGFSCHFFPFSIGVIT